MKDIIINENNFLRKVLVNFCVNSNLKLRESVAERTVIQIRQNLRELGIENPTDFADDTRNYIDHHVKNLVDFGVSDIGEVLSKKQISSIHEYLSKKEVYSGHVWGFSDKKSLKLNKARKLFPQACYKLEDIFGAPDLLELAHDPKILGIAQNYIGAPPTFYSCNLMWSFKEYQDPNIGIARNFHRDHDNIKYCTLYVFLSDIDDTHGSHHYMKKTHTSSAINQVVKEGESNNINFTEKEIYILYNLPLEYLDSIGDNLYKNYITELKGKAGHGFIEDPFGYHRGNPPKNSDRLVFWIRYGIFDSGLSADLTDKKINIDNYKNRIPNDLYHRYFYRTFFNYGEEEDKEKMKSVHYQIPNEIEIAIKNLREKYTVKEIEEVLNKRKNLFKIF